MDYASLNGVRVTDAHVTVPYYGAWAGDVSLATSEPVSGKVVLVLGNLTLVGYAVREQLFAGVRTARIVAGFGGWSKTLPARAYQSPGLPVSVVLSDAATEVGELVAGATGSVGPGWCRPSGPASGVLADCVGSFWWIDPAGVTQAGTPRVSTPIGSPFLVEAYDGGRGRLTVSTEDPASWMPGRTVAAPTLPAVLSLRAVTYELTNAGRMRVKALAE